MLRLNELKLPLNHLPADLNEAVLAHLGVTAADLLDVAIFKRSYDARKKTQILLIYQLDITLPDAVEAALLASAHKPAGLQPSPDTSYQFVARAAADFPS